MKSWTRRYYDTAANQRDLSIVDEIAADVFISCSNNLWEIRGAEGIRASVGRLLAAFPDVHFSIAEMLVDQNVQVEENLVADRVCLWWHLTGHFEGELAGIAPTGRLVTVRGASLLLVQEVEGQFKLISAQAVSDIYQAIGQLPKG